MVNFWSSTFKRIQKYKNVLGNKEQIAENKQKQNTENSLMEGYMVTLKVILSLILEVMVLKHCNQKE